MSYYSEVLDAEVKKLGPCPDPKYQMRALSNGLQLQRVKDKEYPIAIQFKLYGSPTCCGLLEIGSFIHADAIGPAAEYFWTSALGVLKKAVMIDTIVGYTPALWVERLGFRELISSLERLGFVKSLSFHNPNSGNIVIQWALTLRTRDERP